jgi:hypothetical protein
MYAKLTGCHIVWYIFTDISREVTASMFRTEEKAEFERQ